MNKDYEILKCENTKIKEELSTLKQCNYKDINESLRFNINNLRTTNLKLNGANKTMSKQIKTLSLTKTKTIEATARKYLLSIFSPNQLDIMLKKKKKVCWTNDEISKAFRLRYFSKRAYIYVKNELHYPLPSKFTNFNLYL